MGRFLLRRILQTIPLVIGISILVFLVLQKVPGGPMTVYAQPGTRHSPAELQQIRHQLGLDRPLHVQYGIWLSKAARGDFGWSYQTSKPAGAAIARRIPATIELLLAAVILAVILAIPIGLYSAYKKNTWFDHTATSFSYLGYAIPVFWLGLIAQLVFSLYLGWLPTANRATPGLPFSFADHLLHLILPVSVLTLALVASWSRFLRSSVLEQLGQDYVRTARAKGLTERRVLTKHIMRNSMIPMVTQIAIEVPLLFGGTIMTETVFSWPGMGLLLWQSLLRRDYAVVQGILIIVALLVMIFNIIADVLYSRLNPRIGLN